MAMLHETENALFCVRENRSLKIIVLSSILFYDETKLKLSERVHRSIGEEIHHRLKLQTKIVLTCNNCNFNFNS